MKESGKEESSDTDPSAYDVKPIEEETRNKENKEFEWIFEKDSSIPKTPKDFSIKF